MKKIRISRLIMIICIATINILMIVQINDMKNNYTSVSVRLESKVSKKMLFDALKYDEGTCKIEKLTAYSQQQGFIMSKELEQKSMVYQFCLCGNIEDVMPVSLVSGNLLIKEDNFGCVLSQEAAYHIFGGLNIIGLELKINDKLYVIRGIVKTSVEAVFYESDSEDDTFDCLEFMIQDDDGEYYARQFAGIYGLPKATVIGGNYLVSVVGNLCLIPFILLVVMCNILFIRKSRKYHKKKRLCIVVCFISLFGLILLCLGCGYFPERWIPVKWSDFGHYNDIWFDMKQQFSSLLFARPIVKDVVLKLDFLKVFALIVVTFTGQFLVLREINDYLERFLKQGEKNVNRKSLHLFGMNDIMHMMQ